MEEEIDKQKVVIEKSRREGGRAREKLKEKWKDIACGRFNTELEKKLF